MAKSKQTKTDNGATPAAEQTATARMNARLDELRVAVWETGGRKRFPSRTEVVERLLDYAAIDLVKNIKGG